jgi:two-component system, sensor histidine kinase and response regulator
VNLSASTKANILLVDDDPAKRLGLGAVLNSLGHNLYMAESGDEALRLVLHRDYAVILLDVRMPGMDGFETAKLIRSRRRSAHTPIIFITAYDQAEIETLRGYAMGAVDYIFAPVIPEILRAKVSAFVDLALMREELEAEITQRKRANEKIDALNERLNQRAAQLEVANKELESFAYSVSHDLRAPLRAIRGFSQILEEEYGDRLDDEGRRVLRVVLENSENMSELIDVLLAFSRFNEQPIEATEIDMAALAHAVFGEVASTRAQAPEFRMTTLPPARGDVSLIRQVWTNLLSNAVKYSGHRERAVVDVSGRTEGVEEIYCVKDNGAGFDMRNYDKLFGVFQRLHDPQQYPGTGVGLAIVQRVVSRHGGRVWAEGKVDEGAAFYFSLPGVIERRSRP